MNETKSTSMVGKKFKTTPMIGTSLDHLYSLSHHDIEMLYGRVSAKFEKNEIIAGSDVKIRIKIQFGINGFKKNSTIALVWRMPEDWGEPQFEHLGESNFFSAKSSKTNKLKLKFSHRSGPAPWGHMLTIENEGVDLRKSDVLDIFCGNNEKNYPGWQAPTSINPKQFFMILQRPKEEQVWVKMAELQNLKIVPGEASEISITVPSQVVINETISIIIRMTDIWGNPSRGYKGDFCFDNSDMIVNQFERLKFNNEEIDVWKFNLTIFKQGIHRIRVRTKDNLFSSISNPIKCMVSLEMYSVYWGDMHSGQCNLGCGQGDLESYFQFAKDVAGIQFMSHQANDVYVTKYDWEYIRKTSKRFNEDNSFLVFLGCEWTAPRDKGGDHNIYYYNDQKTLNRASKWFEGPFDDWPEASDPNKLYDQLKSTKALVNLHVGGFTSNLHYHNPGLEKMIEIHSTHGISQWFIEEAFDMGYKMGITAGSDGVSGRPGLEHPGRKQTRNIGNGATAVLAKELKKTSIWDALSEKRFYATTGERILLDFEINRKNIDKDIYQNETRKFFIRVNGTAPIEKVLLRRKDKIIDKKIFYPDSKDNSTRFRILWSGCKEKGTSRHQKLKWDGSLRTSNGRLNLRNLINFYQPTDNISILEKNNICWKNSTAGNESGFTFDWICNENTNLEFISQPYADTFAYKKVEKGIEIPVDGVENGLIQICKAPSEDGPLDVELELIDEEKLTGCFPYWVEVIQINRARAWGSPIYINILN